MFKIYKLEIEKKQGIRNRDVIDNYLDLYNGHAGYTYVCTTLDEENFIATVGQFVLEWNPYRDKDNIIALVVEDENENIIDYLYETEEGSLQWAENYDFLKDLSK